MDQATKEQLDAKPMAADVNPNAVEPSQYFTVIKDKVTKVDPEALQKQLDTVAQSLIRAKKIGQKSMIDRLSFTYDVIIKEQTIGLAGFKKYVYQKDVEFLLDKLKQIKMIELDRFPRIIPTEKMDDIIRAKELNIFDEFVVVFTDLSNNDYKSPEDKAYVARNRDPIVFGLFMHKKSNIVHDRMYFITDWEDQFCEFTFGQMIEELAKLGLEKPSGEIAADHDYVAELVHHTLQDMGTRFKNFESGGALSVSTPVKAIQMEPVKAPIYKRVRTWFQK